VQVLAEIPVHDKGVIIPLNENIKCSEDILNSQFADYVFSRTTHEGLDGFLDKNTGKFFVFMDCEELACILEGHFYGTLH